MNRLSIYALVIILQLNISCNKELDTNDPSVNNHKENQILGSAITAISDGYQYVHDSQILVAEIKDRTLIILVYCTINPFNNIFQVYDAETNENLVNESILADSNIGDAGWAPRVFMFNENTVRVVFSINRSSVFYRDFDLFSMEFGPINPFKIRYQLNNNELSDLVSFNLDIYSKHILNTLAVDLNSSAFRGFNSRYLLINGTDQLQKVGTKYFLTAAILSDAFIGGDAGGISSLIESDDLTNWTLRKPVSVNEIVEFNREHEMSMTFINQEWHGLSRLNLGASSGYQYWKSKDGDDWQSYGFAPIPNAIKGYRNSVFVMKDDNERDLAFIAYQKFSENDRIDINNHSAQRRSIGISITRDFITFKDIISFENDQFNTYPSICIYNNILYISWSTGKYSFVENILFSKIDLSIFEGFSNY